MVYQVIHHTHFCCTMCSNSFRSCVHLYTFNIIFPFWGRGGGARSTVPTTNPFERISFLFLLFFLFSPCFSSDFHLLCVLFSVFSGRQQLRRASVGRQRTGDDGVLRGYVEAFRRAKAYPQEVSNVIFRRGGGLASRGLRNIIPPGGACS